MKRPQKERRPSNPGPRVSLGRDRAFKAALAREYGVTEVPRRLQRRTERTLESLPDTLPVRHRPVLRAVRSLAASAAVLAVSFAALLGLNTTHPQLTEALPGLGTVFAAMNGSSSLDPGPAPSAEPKARNEFQPVTAFSTGDFDGVLVIEDAWSDGKSLLLDMSISPGDSFYEVCRSLGWDDNISLWPAVVKYNEFGDEYADNNCSLTAYADDDFHNEEGSFAPAFTPDGEGRLRARWFVDLGSLEVGERLKVDLRIPDVTASSEAYDAASMYSWYSGFEANFTLPVTSNDNRAFSLQSSDGPVTLRSVEYAPSRVELDVSLPYLGMIGDFYEESGDAFEYPLGSFARLTCMDGAYEYGLDTPEPAGYKDISPGSSLDMHYVFCAEGPADGIRFQDLKGPLTFTIYELFHRDGPAGRVLAEFTIDLSTGRAYPSENYAKSGLEKSDPALTTQQRLESAMTDGLLPLSAGSGTGVTGDYGPYSQFTLYSDLSFSGRELEVRGYLNGTLEHTFTFIIDGGDYGDSGGSYSTSVYTLPSSGQEYLSTTVIFSLPDELVNDDGGYIPFDRLELADPLSDEVIIPDIDKACAEAMEQLLGPVAAGYPEPSTTESERSD